MKPIDILSSHNLKRTSCREGIIEVIMNAEQALSEFEIREKLHGNYDRSTFYRSFKTLEEHNVIHRINIDNQLVKYAFCAQQSHVNGHLHGHFYCRECHTVRCLDPMSGEAPVLPDGYSADETVIIVKGLCPVCRISN
ncbi:MAG TPA: transcriptional repressor [Bacteroidales bacterium]|nr:transcriptional repressor [Bacteroidales bacterium]